MAICPKCGKEITLSQKELSTDKISCGDCREKFLTLDIFDITSFETDSCHRPRRIKINESFDHTELRYKRIFPAVLVFIPISTILLISAFDTFMTSFAPLYGKGDVWTDLLAAFFFMMLTIFGIMIIWGFFYHFLKRTSVSISSNGDVFIAEGAVRFWKRYQINASDVEIIRVRNLSAEVRAKQGLCIQHHCFIQFVLKDKRIISFGEDMKENEKKYAAAFLKEILKI